MEVLRKVRESKDWGKRYEQSENPFASISPDECHSFVSECIQRLANLEN